MTKMDGDDGLTHAAFRTRAVGPPMRGGDPDQVLECLECGALVTYDKEVMWRHITWHQQL